MYKGFYLRFCYSVTIKLLAVKFIVMAGFILIFFSGYIKSLELHVVLSKSAGLVGKDELNLA